MNSRWYFAFIQKPKVSDLGSDLNNALRQFEIVQANVAKLQRLWSQIAQMLPEGTSIGFPGDPSEYRRLVRRFDHIVERLPTIDCHRLECEFTDPDDVLGNTFDYAEIGEPFAHLSYVSSLHEPGERLDEYAFRVAAKRRQLARDAAEGMTHEIESVIAILGSVAESKQPGDKMESEDWERLRTLVKSIDTLLGNAIERPARWSDLCRHLKFAERHDFDDIVEHDWPAVRNGLEAALYDQDEPIPVDVDDLGDLVASRPSGPVATELNWGSLTDSGFERLVFNLVDRTEGYENPEWLTHTNAPDRGRDVSVNRVVHDALAASRRARIIIACKKQKSVSLPEVAKLKEQMTLWEPPRVDELIVATSGRFTTDAVQWIERHNQADNLLRIEMWPESHLERLLAERPELIAEFGLR